MEYQVALQGDIYLLSKGSPLTTLQYPRRSSSRRQQPVHRENSQHLSPSASSRAGHSR